MSAILDRAALALVLLGAACSSSEPTPIGGADAAANEDAAQAPPIDGGVVEADAAPDLADSGPMPNMDAAANPGDAAASPDAAMPGVSELVPGSHVTIASAGRISIGDDYSAVTRLLGRGTRSMGMAQRSYEWALAGGVELTVWFTNSNLDDDDDPPNDVDATDTVLWIAVGGTFAARTAGGIGVGSTRMATEAAYGPSPRTTPLTMPSPGELTAYYTRGFLAAFGQDGLLRTFTVCKAYGHAPDGRIDIPQTRLTFANPMGNDDDITARAAGGSGRDVVLRVLGPPDSEGAIPNQNGFSIMNYAFIGLEVILSSGNAFTAIVHAPFYGTTGNGTPGLGAQRTEFETYVQQTLMGSGPRASSRTMGVFCFTVGGRSFGVTYSADMPATVSGIILGPCL